MALITEITLPEDLGISDEIQFRTVFTLEEFDPILICMYLTKDLKKPVHQEVLNIPTDIYNSWGLDNQIVIDWAIEALGHTRV